MFIWSCKSKKKRKSASGSQHLQKRLLKGAEWLKHKILFPFKNAQKLIDSLEKHNKTKAVHDNYSNWLSVKSKGFTQFRIGPHNILK